MQCRYFFRHEGITEMMIDLQTYKGEIKLWMKIVLYIHYSLYESLQNISSKRSNMDLSFTFR